MPGVYDTGVRGSAPNGSNLGFCRPPGRGPLAAAFLLRRPARSRWGASLAWALVFGVLAARPGRLEATPKELGAVAWRRDFRAAEQEARRVGRPLLILFDEVPGCQTCVRYGTTVLSDPLIVEAVESHFVPVAVYNNKAGADRRVLKRFKEPAWNNPVVRIVQAQGLKALAPRVAGDYSRAGLIRAMTRALRASGQAVPPYLALRGQELSPADARALVSMHCFWAGQACLASDPRVVAARPGFAGGREVVEFGWRGSSDELVRFLDAARAKDCFGRLEAASPAALAAALKVPLHRAAALRYAAKDDRYHLRRSRWRFVPMSPLQGLRVNAALATGQAPDEWLSPRQRQLVPGEAASKRSGAVEWALRADWADGLRGARDDGATG